MPLDNIDKLLKFIQSIPAHSSPTDRGVYLRSDATPEELATFRQKIKSGKFNTCPGRGNESALE